MIALEKIRRVAFDFDGVIVESIPAHRKSRVLAFEQLGLVVSDDDQENAHHLGASTLQIITELVKKSNMPVSDNLVHTVIKLKADIYKKLLAEDVLLVDGVVNLIKTVFDRWGKSVIVTAEDRAPVEGAIERLGLSRYFDMGLSITNTETPRELTKPNPFGYKKAAKNLGINTDNLLVFEDSLHGGRAAVSSGAQTILLTTTTPIDSLESIGADEIVDLAGAISLLS